MVMLERMFLASEKEVLAEEKKQAEQDPGTLVGNDVIIMVLI